MSNVEGSKSTQRWPKIVDLLPVEVSNMSGVFVGFVVLKEEVHGLSYQIHLGEVYIYIHIHIDSYIYIYLNRLYIIYRSCFTP